MQRHKQRFILHGMHESYQDEPNDGTRDEPFIDMDEVFSPPQTKASDDKVKRIRQALRELNEQSNI